MILKWCGIPKSLRVGLHNGPCSRTMENSLFSWSNFMVQFPWFDFLKYQFSKLLGPSLGVNQMWTKRNDHAPKCEWADYFNICRKMVVLKKNQVRPFYTEVLDEIVCSGILIWMGKKSSRLDCFSCYKDRTCTHRRQIPTI